MVPQTLQRPENFGKKRCECTHSLEQCICNTGIIDALAGVDSSRKLDSDAPNKNIFHIPCCNQNNLLRKLFYIKILNIFCFSENYIGMALVMVGTIICMFAKMSNETPS